MHAQMPKETRNITPLATLHRRRHKTKYCPEFIQRCFVRKLLACFKQTFVVIKFNRLAKEIASTQNRKLDSTTDYSY